MHVSKLVDISATFLQHGVSTRSVCVRHGLETLID